MDDAQKAGVLNSLFRMPRFGPALFATLLAGIMMLFLNELEKNIRQFMIPSLVIYALGAALLGSIHRLLGSHYYVEDDRNTEKSIPWGWRVGLLVVHLIWFGVLVFYNCLRDVL